MAEVNVKPVGCILMAGAATAGIMVRRRRMAGAAICAAYCAVIKVNIKPVGCILMAGAATAGIMVRWRRMAGAAIHRANRVMTKVYYQKISRVCVTITASAAVMIWRRRMAGVAILRPHKSVIKANGLPILHPVAASAIQAISPFVRFILSVAVDAVEIGSLIIPLRMASGTIGNLVTAD